MPGKRDYRIGGKESIDRQVSREPTTTYQRPKPRIVDPEISWQEKLVILQRFETQYNPFKLGPASWSKEGLIEASCFAIQVVDDGFIHTSPRGIGTTEEDAVEELWSQLRQQPYTILGRTHTRRVYTLKFLKDYPRYGLYERTYFQFDPATKTWVEQEKEEHKSLRVGAASV